MSVTEILPSQVKPFPTCRMWRVGPEHALPLSPQLEHSTWHSQLLLPACCKLVEILNWGVMMNETEGRALIIPSF